MEIISHRGYWLRLEEKNTIAAFKRSFSLGFGTETDVRDYNGELVISHDIPRCPNVSLSEFLDLYNSSSNKETIAINIKSDGLQAKILNILKTKGVDNYFLFDMSIPDLIQSIKSGLNSFSRYSEFEPESKIWQQCNGIWYDLFESENLNLEFITSILTKGSRICIVSSELHGMNHLNQWKRLRTLSTEYLNSTNLILCTDLPEKARGYFNDK